MRQEVFDRSSFPLGGRRIDPGAPDFFAFYRR